MFARTRAFLNLGNTTATNPRYYKHGACFTSLSDQLKRGSTPGKLSQKDPAVEGNEGGYGGSGISDLGHGGSTPGNFSVPDPAAEVNEIGYGESAGIYEGGWSEGATTNNQGGGNRGGRRREAADAGGAARDTAEMAKAGVVGAVEVGLKLGEMAKQTVDVMWDATRRTAETVRDSVADDDSRDRGFDGGHVDGRKRRTSDRHVDDVRRGAGGGYDFKGH